MLRRKSTKNVDHGKTTLLDKIRKTGIAAAEAGQITQEIGATVVPTKVIKEICGKQLEKMGIKLTIPGLLFIDTPGHEAFTSLRKRGGSIADLAILLVDINDGLQPQTLEAIEILKMYKVPFIVALNKIDTMYRWRVSEDACFADTYKGQADDVCKELDTKLYKLIGELHSKGFNSELYSRVDDFTNQVVIVPMSGKTGEGMPELLLFLAGISQKFMEGNLEIDVSGPAKGTVLEVKEIQGLGTTIDAIIYGGVLRVGDTIVVGGRGGPIVSKVKALLEPLPMQEIRGPKKNFRHVDEVHASAGVKINASGLEDAIAGSSVLVANDRQEEIVRQVAEELGEITIETDKNGIVLKADALGSLEAIISLLGKEGIPIKHASVGPVTRRDVIEAEAVGSNDLYLGVVFAFNVPVLADAKEEAEAAEVRVFETKIVYKLAEEYGEWKEKRQAKEKEELLKSALYPVKLRVLPGYVFRSSKPAVVGVEVLEGVLKSPIPLMGETGKSCGRLKSLQEENKTIGTAVAGKQVAVSIMGVTVGRQISEGDILYTNIPLKQIPKLEKEVEEVELLRKIKVIKREHKEAVA